MAYYQIYWGAIRALTPREQLEVLADIAATVPVEMARSAPASSAEWSSSTPPPAGTAHKPAPPQNSASPRPSRTTLARIRKKHATTT